MTTDHTSSEKLTATERALQDSYRGIVGFRMKRISLHRISGPDAVRYTHGRLTQDVATLSDECREFMLLEPQGQPLAIGRIARISEDALVLSSETSESQSFADDFLRFKVADQLAFETITEHFEPILLVGEPSHFSAEGALGALLSTPAESLNSISQFKSETVFTLSVPSKRHLPHLSPTTTEDIAEEESVTSCIVCVPRHCAEDFVTTCTQSDIPIYTEADYELLRIQLLQPSAVELATKSIATDFEYPRYISFNKGCYAGQEVVEMSTARGRPRAILSAIEIPDATNISGGEKITRVISAQETKSIGTLTSVSHSPSKSCSFALGFIKTGSLVPGANFSVDAQPCRIVPWNLAHPTQAV